MAILNGPRNNTTQLIVPEGQFDFFNLIFFIVYSIIVVPIFFPFAPLFFFSHLGL